MENTTAQMAVQLYVGKLLPGKEFKVKLEHEFEWEIESPYLLFMVYWGEDNSANILVKKLDDGKFQVTEHPYMRSTTADHYFLWDNSKISDLRVETEIENYDMDPESLEATMDNAIENGTAEIY